MVPSAAAVCAAYILTIVFEGFLEYLNVGSLRVHGNELPREFRLVVDPDTAGRSRDYTIDNTRLRVVSSVFVAVVTAVFVFAGPLEAYNRWVGGFGLSLAVSGLAFFIPLLVAGTVITIPFSAYRTFVIERRYGFSSTTPVLWVTDLFKSTAVTVVISSAVIAAGLWLVRASPGLWWLWVWVFFVVFTVFLMYLSPYVLDPLFNRFTPLERDDPALAEDIKRLLGRAGLAVSRVFKMDASKRTAHTNAYFGGLGRAKRIVLYDTLLGRLDPDEVLAVVAHEAGHWRLRHVAKRIAATEAVALAGLYLSHRLLEADLPNRVLGVEGGGFLTGVFCLAFLASIVLYPFMPVAAFLSRRHERQADRFAVRVMGGSAAMVSSLVKLSRDNLSNLHPHPLYAAFHYTHPPVLERIRTLERMDHVETG